MRQHLFLALLFLSVCMSYAIDPTATKYTPEECQGSLRPYTPPTQAYTYPDSLTPVYISHVGRHGSRYPASASNCKTLAEALQKASEQGTITPLGRKLKALVDNVIALSAGQWGALDSLGMAEQRGIASRMHRNYPDLFKGTTVSALSSYSPRSMMSMYSFVHQLDRLNNNIEVTTVTGRSTSQLMRPFDTDTEYRDWIASGAWKEPYDTYYASVMPGAPAARVLGASYDYGDSNDKALSLTEYYVLAGLSAMSVDVNLLDYFSAEELNAAWSVFNLRQYLQRAASTLSATPAEIAAPLVLDIIARTDNFIAGSNPATVDLRFGHAETLFPLYSLLHIPGSYYLTNYYDTVRQHWCDFRNVPMAANIQFILFKSKRGRYYVRVDVNEAPVAMIPNDSREYIPWGEARDYMTRCVPIYAQP